MAFSADVVSVLAVSDRQDEIVFLEHVFSHSKWHLRKAATCREAISLLQTQELPIVVCSCQMPDGSWKDLLAAAAGRPHTPHLIVIAPHADDQLWSEVLDLGGYDLLAKPLETGEVVRVISLAWRQWQEHRFGQVHRPFAL